MEAKEDSIEVQAKNLSHRARCPTCGQASTAVHGWYSRHPQELPSVGNTMRLKLQVRRFYCNNPQCSQKTFAERFPDWLAVYARRTQALTQLMYRVALEIGGEAGQRIVSYISVQVSGDTLLRVIRRHTHQASVLPRIIGVDDWAFKKGRSYGTILVNLETHRVIDLLPDRSAETLAGTYNLIHPLSW